MLEVGLHLVYISEIASFRVFAHTKSVSTYIIRPFLGLHLGLRFGFTFWVYDFGFTFLGLRFWFSRLVPRDFPGLTKQSYAPSFRMSKHPRTTICSYQLLTAYGQIVRHDLFAHANLPNFAIYPFIRIFFIHLSESF